MLLEQLLLLLSLSKGMLAYPEMSWWTATHLMGKENLQTLPHTKKKSLYGHYLSLTLCQYLAQHSLEMFCSSVCVKAFNLSHTGGYVIKAAGLQDMCELTHFTPDFF